MNERRVLVGVYPEQFQAERALQEFHELGFRDDQLDLVMYTGDASIERMLDDLAEMGVSEEEIDNYKHEFKAGRAIVIVRCERPAEVLNQLFRSGYVKVRLTNTPVSSQQELETPPGTLSSDLPTAPGAQENEDTTTSLHRLLKDAGFDHLL